MDVIFEKESVTVRLRDYRKQNLLFSVKKLCGEIVASDCKYLLKSNSLALVLYKKDSKSWSQLAFKEDSVHLIQFSLASQTNRRARTKIQMRE